MPDTGGQQRWVVKLDKIGFAVSTGSACASGQEKPSHVLAAMGYGPSETGRVLRFSSGWETTMADWNALAEGLVSVHLEMRERGPKLAGIQAGGSLNPSLPQNPGGAP
jgi:cysteine desulfurase